MAEFCEVMRTLSRMCRSQGEEACDTTCPLSKCDGFSCAVALDVPIDVEAETLAEIERIVMDWAEKNPEPRYPTWVEWWSEKFGSEGRRMFTPCSFVPPAKLGCSIEKDGCMSAPYRCWHTPIPVDIAEELGVKPIGGT